MDFHTHHNDLFLSQNHLFKHPEPHPHIKGMRELMPNMEDYLPSK
jgi:hypothetical protein